MGHKLVRVLFCLLVLMFISGSSESRNMTDVEGLWGGQHISMEVTDDGATIQYDCGHGKITEKIVPDRRGKFSVKGVHVRERGGPVRQGEDHEEAASYVGSIKGDTMTLTVKLTEARDTLGTFTLTRGKAGRLVRCL
jgi:hypothetical protein